MDFANYDLSEPPKQDQRLVGTGNVRQFKKIPSISDVLQLLMSTYYQRTESAKELRALIRDSSTCIGAAEAQAQGLVNDVFYDSIFSDCLLYYGIVGIKEDIATSWILKPLGADAIARIQFYDVDVRAWATTFRMTPYGRKFILTLLIPLAIKQYKSQVSSLANAV